MLKTIRWCFMGLCLAFAHAYAIPTLIVDPGTGKLLGADGVDVGGTLYDVRFVDGTCIALFSDCDQVADFTFQSAAAAHLASLALLADVFQDGPSGAFDTRPELTNGCTSQRVCLVLTPRNVDAPAVDVSVASNEVLLGGFDVDAADTLLTFRGSDTSLSSEGVYAVWTPQVAAETPLPGTLSCLGIGMLALVWAHRRRALARCRTQ